MVLHLKNCVHERLGVSMVLLEAYWKKLGATPVLQHTTDSLTESMKKRGPVP